MCVSAYACIQCDRTRTKSGKREEIESDEEAAEVVLEVDEVLSLWCPGEAWV